MADFKKCKLENGVFFLKRSFLFLVISYMNIMKYDSPLIFLLYLLCISSAYIQLHFFFPLNYWQATKSCKYQTS